MAYNITIHTDFVDESKVEGALEKVKKIVSQALQREVNESDKATSEDFCE